MKPLRLPTSREKALIEAMLQGTPAASPLIRSLDHAQVADMADGGMGSLRIAPRGVENADRLFGAELVLAEFVDSDGVPVSVTLNLDSAGQLYELDIWKADFSRPLQWPEPSALRIMRSASRIRGQRTFPP